MPEYSGPKVKRVRTKQTSSVSCRASQCGTEELCADGIRQAVIRRYWQ